jgi:predicted RNA-binding Zn-ribbon protein involved in translation (DUF1610 family)
MGNIMKFGLDRLGQRRFELKMDCPNCGSARIIFSAGNGRGHPEDVACPKCGMRVILDGLSVTVLNENGTGSLSTGDQLLQSKGSIL